jgi:hypothetical protein
MSSKYRIVLQLSTVTDLLSKAKAISSLAEAHPEEADTLSACMAVILAAALDQGITDVLSGYVTNYAVENEVPMSATPYSAILRETLRRRMQHMPEILTNGRFQLNPDSPHTQALHELIGLRNELMHVSDKARVLTETSNEVQIEGSILTISVPLPQSLWSTVTIEQVRNYQTALDIYFSEILFPESGEIRTGRIVSQVA